MNLNRDDLRALAIMAALAAAICWASFAWATDPAPQLPAGVTCDHVRTRVAELGETAGAAAGPVERRDPETGQGGPEMLAWIAIRGGALGLAAGIALVNLARTQDVAYLGMVIAAIGAVTLLACPISPALAAAWLFITAGALLFGAFLWWVLANYAHGGTGR